MSDAPPVRDAAPLSLDQRLARNLAEIRRRIAAETAHSRRPPGSVRLVAVTKYVGPAEIAALLRLGQRDLAENRVQQLAARMADLGASRGDLRDPGPPPAPCWHMIGHLQRNKVRQLLPECRIVHGLDSPRLAEELHRRASALGITVDVLLEVNISGEARKEGVPRAALPALADAVTQFPTLRLCGLMTMAPQGASEGECRRVFAGLREALDELQKRGAPLDCRELSMGMTSDFESAIAEGATIVRIGSALFA